MHDGDHIATLLALWNNFLAHNILVQRCEFQEDFLVLFLKSLKGFLSKEMEFVL